MASLREDNRQLTQTVSELRAARRAQDRKLRDLQHQLDEARANGAGVPTLPVEVVGPAGGTPVAVTATLTPTSSANGERVVGVAEDGTEIVYEGEAAMGHAAPPISAAMLNGEAESDDTAASAPVPRRARSQPLPVSVPTTTDGSSAGDRIEVTRRIPPISAPISARAATRTKTRDVHDAPGDRGGDAASEYRAAVELVKAGKQDDAITALRAFIAKYPRHDYADNAQYWLGEAFYAQKDFTRALTEFRQVIEVYPRGNKVPDALLKVGYCYQALGQGEKAHAVLEQVVTRYPKSEPATLAAKRLETP